MRSQTARRWEEERGEESQDGFPESSILKLRSQTEGNRECLGVESMRETSQGETSQGKVSLRAKATELENRESCGLPGRCVRQQADQSEPPDLSAVEGCGQVWHRPATSPDLCFRMTTQK